MYKMLLMCSKLGNCLKFGNLTVIFILFFTVRWCIPSCLTSFGQLNVLYGVIYESRGDL